MAAVAPATVIKLRRPQSSLATFWSFSGRSLAETARRIVFMALILMAVSVSMICPVLAVQWTNKPFAGFLVNERMVPGNVGQYHWTGTEAGLNYQDKILKANDQPLRSRSDLDTVVRNVPVGTPIRYLVERGSQARELTIPTMRFTWADLLVIFGGTFLVGIALLLIGLIVFLVKPDTRASWAFLLACLFPGIYAMTVFDIQSTHWGFVRLYLLVQAFWPASLIHLSLVFPEERKLVARRPSLLFAPYVVSALLLTPIEILYPRPLFVQIYKLVMLYMPLGALALVVSSVQAYISKTSVLGRQRAKVVLFGAALAFPITTAAHYLSLFQGVSIQLNFVAIPVLFFPAAIAYAIAKHNLFDVDVYIKRAVGYGAMTAILGVTYLSTQTVMNAAILTVFGEGGQKLSPILFALLVVLFFNPVNRKVQESIDRIFFRKTLDYKQTISRVSNALTSLLNFDQIVRQVVHTIRKEMFIDTAGVIVLEPQKQKCWTFFVGDQPGTAKDNIHEVPIGYDDPLLALVRERKALITKYDVEEDPRYDGVRDRYLRSLSAMAATVAFPLVSQGEVKGLIALGQKKSGHFYSTEDIDLLNTMANQAAVAIENATTHEEVVRYANDLAASLRRIQILESIKTNLAKFVPKTVQDLIEESPEAPSLEKREADVSVVFADITGYTRLSAQMELDQVNRLVERYFGAFLDEIVKCGGDVNETAGDGLMVIFRDPDSSRHARAAVLAALGIQRRTREINDELRGEFEPITMHIGVNSGIASVGATKIEGAAGTRWTYTASGPTTNVAARLAGLGEGGAIVVSDETRQRLDGEFEVEDMGPQTLKNVAQPVRVYQVKEPRAVAVGVFPERRRHPRRLVSWPVRVWVGERSYEGRAVDASLYGVCVTSIPLALLSVGKSYRLEIITGDSDELLRVAEVQTLGDWGIGMEVKEPLPLD